MYLAAQKAARKTLRIGKNTKKIRTAKLYPQREKNREMKTDADRTQHKHQNAAAAAAKIVPSEGNKQ